MHLLVPFVQLILLIHSCARSATITIPWTSSLLKDNNTFTVFLGDVIIFCPCGDSDNSTVAVTHSQPVFGMCLLIFDMDEKQYCNDPSGCPKLVVDAELTNISDNFYVLSDYQSECENGLKAAFNVLHSVVESTEIQATHTLDEVGSTPDEDSFDVQVWSTTGGVYPAPSADFMNTRFWFTSEGITSTFVVEMTDDQVGSSAGGITRTRAADRTEVGLSTSGITPTPATDTMDDQGESTSEGVNPTPTTHSMDNQVRSESGGINPTPSADSMDNSVGSKSEVKPILGSSSDGVGLVSEGISSTPLESVDHFLTLPPLTFALFVICTTIAGLFFLVVIVCVATAVTFFFKAKSEGSKRKSPKKPIEKIGLYSLH